MIATVLQFADEMLTEDSLRMVLQDIEETGAQVVHLDSRGVRLPTAEGLGALVAWNRKLRSGGGELVLVNVPAEVYEVFVVLNLVGVLDLRKALSEQSQESDNGRVKGVLPRQPCHAPPAETSGPFCGRTALDRKQ